MQLNDVVPWGRTLDEYRQMFNLSEADLQRRILGCGDGPASFNAEMAALGRSVISVDPVYQFSAEQIRQQVQATYNLIISQVKQNADHYCWKNYVDADDLGRSRLAAMERFLLDYETGKATGRYRPQALPQLDLGDRSFDLALVSHLLFLYADHQSLEFHLASVRELLRVAVEVRIFPLLKLDGTPAPYVEPVIQDLLSRGATVQIEPVTYEFQRGGNQMLKAYSGPIANFSVEPGYE